MWPPPCRSDRRTLVGMPEGHLATSLPDSVEVTHLGSSSFITQPQDALPHLPGEGASQEELAPPVLPLTAAFGTQSSLAVNIEGGNKEISDDEESLGFGEPPTSLPVVSGGGGLGGLLSSG